MSNISSPLVSIITVSFNSVNTIRETIESVISQDYKNIEYIIVDGNSSDGTMDIVSEYKNYIDIVISEPDDGIYFAMNKGINAANGDIIGIINSDDFYYSDAIGKVVSAWNNHGRPDVISGWVNILNHAGVSQGLIGRPSICWNGEVKIPHPSTFISANTYSRFGNFDTSYKYAADSELFYRLHRVKAIFLFCDEPLASFRQGGFGSRVGFLAQKENFKIEKTYLGLSLALYSLIYNTCLSFVLRHSNLFKFRN